MTTNGLAQLQGKVNEGRELGKRNAGRFGTTKTSAREVLPPSHAVSASSKSSAQNTQEDVAPATQPPTAPVSPAEPTARSTSRDGGVESPRSASAFRRATVYLDSDMDPWLTSIVASARAVDRSLNSSSMVVRLAIARLREQLTDAEIIGALLEARDRTQAPGGRLPIRF